ncbi:Hypothetical protein CINCED_3A011119 [Cinara cedri]|uniref:Homeobox protein prospero n=1 Tax=Cinara cedri TaxID=506608 RepID=A0A5E4NJA8_9HEMI|nr:Hypothetical protein CINCED_3A011119 [Cinara cedri]
MLNEFIGRQVKEEIMTMDSADCMMTQQPLSGIPNPAAAGLNSEHAHHMLRDILQGRKKELLALEHEFRNNADDPSSPDNMNNNNNINNNKNVSLQDDCTTTGSNKESKMEHIIDNCSNKQTDSAEVSPINNNNNNNMINNHDVDDLNEGSDSERSLGSPESDTKEIATAEEQSKDSEVKVEQNELKKARVENIVSTMRSSPSLPVQVNGCKKRKLYHPQQHDNSERYNNHTMDVDDDDDDDDEGLSPNELRQKMVEKNVLKNQLRTMQEQLAKMEQKYVQLCTRMDNDEEPSEDVSDVEQEQPEIPVARNSPPAAPKSLTPPPIPPSPQINPNFSKMVKFLPQTHMPIHPSFNGALTLLQQQVLQEQHNTHNQHHAINNAAAMYLGVSHKLFLEQEASGGGVYNGADAAALGHVRGPQMYAPKLHGAAGLSNAAAAAALYSSMSVLPSHLNPFCNVEREPAPEQNEALSLVVIPKKKRHKVTDTRITPRTVSRILAQDSMNNNTNNNNGPMMDSSSRAPANIGGPPAVQSMPPTGDSPPPSSQQRVFHQQQQLQSPAAQQPPPQQQQPQPPPPPMLPVSLPTSVAIPNPSLHESQVFSPYSPFYTSQHQGGPHHIPSSPPGMSDSPPPPHQHHHGSLLHPALLAAAQHHNSSPDLMSMKARMDMSMGNGGNDSVDRISECNSGDGPYDGMSPISSTLTPMHLRKAKLMFFWVRYPSSAILKMYFPDIKFNKNNTAQLVKWFSNFREFYYIQMEKYARQAVSEGIQRSEDIHVNKDSEIYRVLNLHYNRNNHIEAPNNFEYVVQQTLREFFVAIQNGKDTEQSWKKSIYKVISRMDDTVPEYFRTPNFLEQLE